MPAVASELKFAKPPVEQRAAGWLWLIKKAMNGRRTESKDFGDLVAEFQRGKADPQIYKDTDDVATIEVFTDAEWDRDTKSMKSTSSVFTRIDGFTIEVNAQLQDTHAQGSVESEFYALGAGCADGLYVKAILDDLGMQAKINLRCDANAARALAQRQGLSKRTRHVKVKYLYVQDLVKAREVEVSRVATETNLADMGTKHLPSHRLEFFKSLMGMTFRADPGKHYDESDENSDDDQQV